MPMKHELTRGAALAWQQDHDHGWWMAGPDTPTTTWDGATGKTSPCYDYEHLQDTSSVLWRMIYMGFRNEALLPFKKPIGAVLRIPRAVRTP